MADVTQFDISGGTTSAVVQISAITVATSAQTVPCEDGKDHKIALMVVNGDSSECTVTISAATDGGVRKALGDGTFTVAAGYQRLINLEDTSRYKDLSDNDIDVAVTTQGTIGNIDLYAIQL